MQTNHHKTKKIPASIMKHSLLSTVVLAATSFLTTSAFAQSTWEWVDDYQLVPGKVAGVTGVAAVDNGVVFSSGGAEDASGVRYGFVRRSLDAGLSWLNVLDIPGIAQLAAVTIGPSGRVHVAGPSLANGWVTAVSDNGGSSWAVVNAWAGAGSPLAVVEDVAGRAFVGGYIIDTNKRWHFFIRRSLDGGATWTTVQDLVSPSGNSSVPAKLSSISAKRGSSPRPAIAITDTGSSPNRVTRPR